MTSLQINQLIGEQELTNFFKHYPIEFIQESLASVFEPILPYPQNEDTFSYTMLFYEELNHMIRNCALLTQQIELKDTILIKNNPNIKNLKAIIYFLKELIPASHIFCNTISEERIDLIIIIDRYGYKPYDEIRTLLDFAIFGHPNLNCTVYTYGTISDILTKGHIYFSAVCIPENCVYQRASDCFLPLLSPEQYTIVAHKATTCFNENIHQAINFFNGAQQYLMLQETTMAAFMLQQACELSYRSLILSLRGKEIKCHDLIILRKHLSHFAPEIIGAFDKEEQKELKILAQIQEAYIKSRYDQHYQVCMQELTIHIDAVDHFIQVVQQIFNNKLLKMKAALSAVNLISPL